MNRAAVFLSKYSIGKSSPVLCVLDMLSSACQAVDVYVHDVWCLTAKELEPENVRLIRLPDSDAGILGTCAQWVRYQAARLACADTCYDTYLCFDPHGFLLCSRLFPDARPYYYSLELYFRDNHFNLDYSPEAMARERSSIQRINGLIIQSEERLRLFREEYELSPEIPAFLLPVTYLQPSVSGRSSQLREKYALQPGTRIALHLGGIQEYHSCIELALAFAQIKGWFLIFHGYSFGEYIGRFREVLAENKITNVVISDLVYEKIEDLDPLLMSCDLGVAWYNDVSPNFSTAGKSSGKIAAYLRFGLPVIANRYPSTQEAIEETGCGVCVDRFSDIHDAVRKIEGNLEYHAGNCRREYDSVYWFENYRDKLVSFIRTK